MNVTKVYELIQDRLNKWNTGSGQKIGKRQFVDAFNKMQIQWFEQIIKYRDKDQVYQEEIQRFILDHCVTPFEDKKTGLFCNITLPADYFRWHSVYVNATKDGCTHKVFGLPTEGGGIGRVLLDDMNNPSFEWQEAPFFLSGDKMRFYHNNEFTCGEAVLTYYRYPREIDCEGIVYADGTVGTDVDPEWNTLELHEIIDATVKLLSGDINDQFRHQVAVDQIQRYS